MDNKESLVPENIVQILFDQTRQSSADNTISIKELTLAVNNLIKAVTTPPMNKDVINEIKSSEARNLDKCGEATSMLTNMDSKNEIRTSGIHANLKDIVTNIHNDTQETTEDIEGIINNINKGVKNLSSKVKTMIIVVCVAFSLTTISYLFVRSATNSTVKQCIEQYMKEVKEIER